MTTASYTKILYQNVTTSILSSIKRPLIRQASTSHELVSFSFAHMEALIKMPSSKYCPPVSPLCASFLEKREKALIAAKSTEFGHPTRENLFYVDSSWTFVNHGAFGGAIQVGFKESEEWRRYAELQPLRYFDRDLLPHLAYSCRMLAEFVNSKPSNIALVPNATSGLSSVIRGAVRRLQPGDRVFVFDTSYGSVKKMIKEFCMLQKVKVDIVTFPLPLPNCPAEATETILSVIDSEMQQGTKVAIFDHTTSQTAINMPIVEITTKAKSLGVERVIIDGAHGLLARSLDMKKLKQAGVDFYVSNCHKWLSSPKSVGMLWVANKDLRDECINGSNIISHGSRIGFCSNFIWDGCRDYSAMLVLPTVLRFWKDSIGIKLANDYSNDLLDKAIELLLLEWKNGFDDKLIAPKEFLGPMALVALPVDRQEGTATSKDAQTIQDILFSEYKVECPIKEIRGNLYARISVHTYNELDDYRNLARAVKNILRIRS